MGKPTYGILNGEIVVDYEGRYGFDSYKRAKWFLKKVLKK